VSYDLILSLRMYLERELGESVNGVYAIYDGFDFSTKDKPFVTVRYIDDVSELLVAGRTGYSVDYHMSIDVYASSFSGLLRLGDVVSRLLKVPRGFPLMDEQGVPTGAFATATPSSFTPVPNDDTSDETRNNFGAMPITIDTIQIL
jgi:hypothetical protein